MSTGVAQQLELFMDALWALDHELQELSPLFRQVSEAFMAATPPARRRRYERDLARANRRPSLISNGRKAR